jgi:hypothetical protein
MGLRATAEQANKKQSERGASCHGFFSTGRERRELTEPILRLNRVQIDIDGIMPAPRPQPFSMPCMTNHKLRPPAGIPL